MVILASQGCLKGWKARHALGMSESRGHIEERVILRHLKSPGASAGFMSDASTQSYSSTTSERDDPISNML